VTSVQGSPAGNNALRAAVPGLIGLSLVAGFWWWRGRPLLAATCLGIAFVLLQLSVVRPAAFRRVTRAIDRFAQGLAVAVSVVLLGLTWLVVVVPVALFNRLLRIDLLQGGDAGWRPVARGQRPRRLYSRETRRSGDLGRRAVRLAVVVLALGAATTVVVDRATSLRPPPITPFGSRGTGESAGVVYDDHWVTYRGAPISRHLFPGEPWAAEVLEIQDPVPPCDAVNVRAAYDESLRYSSEYVNVTAGRRRTLTVERPAFTVWMFGGSTTYGIGQRDDFTIPSALVRHALSEGLRLEVLNFGCPGKVNWAETTEFELLLRSGEMPPDAAVFLDGINEWHAAFTREVVGLLDPDVPFAGYASEEDQEALLADARRRGYVEAHDQERQMRLAAAQYRMGVERARDLSEEFDVPVVHFWQPALFTMPATAPGNPTVYHNDEMDPASSLVSGRFYEQAVELSGVEPIDLMDIFDDATQPLYFDCCHTNEAGARLEAEAMYPFILAALRR
jgi:hypothetical protein